MVAARSRMKQAESVAHSSGRSGGDSLVFEYPDAGVLQKIPIAIGCIPRPDAVMQPNDGPACPFRHFTIAQAAAAAATRPRDHPTKRLSRPEKCLGVASRTVYAALLPARR